MENREKFSSRLGFLLISAGCAIGLGNVWRFPYITGKYGGAAFVLLYLLFLVVFGLPIMIMELTVGRGSQKSFARSFDVLEKKDAKWHCIKWVSLCGNYLLMMFYTTVAGWMLAYTVKSAAGTFKGLDADGVGTVFGSMLGNVGEVLGWMLVTVLIGFFVCSLGLQKGVERITKWMMASLFVIMLILCVRSMTLPGAKEGLAFYLVPDFDKLMGDGIGDLSEAVYAAMGQAFFTLGLGVGSMAIFGSYIGKERSLTGEALNIGILDTMVAFMAGLIIFPACASFGVDPGEGPSLVFLTLPNVFNKMPGGVFWGFLFFLFMSCAALSTVIAVFENIISFSMDQWGWERKKAVWVNGLLMALLSMPCCFGYNIWSKVQIPGIGDIQSIEDFMMTNNILPIGTMVYVLFCMTRWGWGWDNFIKEANTGKGLKFPKWARWYFTFVLPVLIVIVFIMGYVPKIQAWFGLG